MTSASPFQPKLFCEFIRQVISEVISGFHTLRCVFVKCQQRKSEGKEATLLPASATVITVMTCLGLHSPEQYPDHSGRRKGLNDSAIGDG